MRRRIRMINRNIYKPIITYNNMKCKHQNTRKLFWMNSNPKKWMRTEFSICLGCQTIIIKSAVKVK